jgi:hypothetical protein
MTNQIRLLFYFLLILTLSNCGDKFSIYTIEIRNNTTDTIRIFYKGNTSYTNRTDSIIAFPNSDTTYYCVEGRTIKSKNQDCDPQNSENEVVVKTSSNRTLVKNIAAKENWSCETDEKNTFWNMYFVIKESDLE